MDYNIKYTDINKTPITIEEATKDDTTLDVALFGRVDLEYGQELNENILHLLENFACPQDATSTVGNIFPDYTVNGNSLKSPVRGQFWFNSTAKRIFVWNGTNWESIKTQGDVAANWGQIQDGVAIPRPVNRYTGYVYEYSECIWAVSPAKFPQAFTYMVCTTDQNAVVNMKYRAYGDNVLSTGIANYLIIGIAGNVNNGTLNVNPQTPYVSATPTPTPTSSVTPTSSITPTVTRTSTPPPSATTTPTPTPSKTRTPTPTPIASPTSTPAPTVTPTTSRTPTPAATRTPTPSPSPASDPCARCSSQGIDCCVVRESYLPDGKTAGDIQVGDSMILADQDTLEPGTGIVSYSEPSLQPCVRIETKSGAALLCSTSAPIPTTEGIVKAPDVFGKFVAVNINNESSWDEVISVEDIGERWVQHITVEDKCFWAGEKSDAFILHHNIKCCYCGGQDCVWTGPNCCDCR